MQTDNDYLLKQPDMNNTYIRRGIHVTIRHMNGTLINDKYGPSNGPYNDSRKTAGEILWFTPQDYMDPNYVEGSEDEPDFHITTRKWDWNFRYVMDKNEAYF